MPIPHVIHHLWKDAAVPDRYRLFRETWRRLHPQWEMRLWTDDDLAALVERDYPHMVDLYRGYDQNICRADLGRYLVLHRFGGVYADLDCECLKPVEPLIEGASFVIGQEPDSHVVDTRAAAAGFDRILCPSFIATEPGHDFWTAVFEGAAKTRQVDDPLEQTGPFLLTRLYNVHPGRSAIRVAPAAQLYPIDRESCWSGRVYDLEHREQATRDAYILHYWDGGWFRKEAPSSGLPAEIPATVNRPTAPRADFDFAGARPKISCVMISQGAPAPAARAIAAFLSQTYADKELIIVAAAPEPHLRDHVRALGRGDVRLARAEEGQSLADLHNLGHRLAEGPLVCRWFEGDLHDPRRLDIQYEILKQTGAHACLTRRWVSWTPASRRLGVVADRPLETSLLCLKAALPAYPSGPDQQPDPVVKALLASARVTSFDMSRLCVHVCDEDQSPDALATTFDGDRYDAVLVELAKRLPIEALERSRRANPAIARGDQSGGDDVRQVPAVAAERRGPAGRARHRHRL